MIILFFAIREFATAHNGSSLSFNILALRCSRGVLFLLIFKAGLIWLFSLIVIKLFWLSLLIRSLWRWPSIYISDNLLHIVGLSANDYTSIFPVDFQFVDPSEFYLFILFQFIHTNVITLNDIKRSKQSVVSHFVALKSKKTTLVNCVSFNITVAIIFWYDPIGRLE